MRYTIAHLAEIVFFICFFIIAVFGGGPIVMIIEWIAAVVAAIALIVEK